MNLFTDYSEGVRLATLTLLLTCPLFAQSWPGAAATDAAILEAIHQGKIPGAVVLIGHGGEIVYQKAYGSRALIPAKEPMTLDTIFDCASLTKVVATTASVMHLFEDGKIRLSDKVTEYLPEFQGGAGDITVRDLMIHFSGLRPDVDLIPEWSGYETGIRKALEDKPAGPPETKFVYSDINFLLMGEIVRRLGGEPLPDYAREHVFEPLRMADTFFQPPASLIPRIAPTERQKDGRILRGTVHDPTARFMGGIAGHAGLFSTAQDLAKFCQMMLNLGTSAEGKRLFQPATVVKFTSSQSPLNQPVLRGLGWDIDSPLSGNRGELFPVGTSYGHTGFTGTSLWLDPSSQTYVILLTNAVHPVHLKPITSLRARIATIAAAQSEERDLPTTLTGLDVWEAQSFAALKGKRVGLITNHTGVNRKGRRNIDLMRAAGINLAALFSPEHGIAGKQDQENIANTVDAATGIRVWSLYEGKNRRPSAEMLKDLDVLVFDIADIGTRFYTYISTMGYAMEEAAKRKLPFVVLDRPNPITGTHVEGPMLSRGELSFVGYFPMPVRHGMTVGELATMFNAENRIGAQLTVVRLQGWRRQEWFDGTGLPWVDPSPNIRSLNQALLYPAVAMLEYSKNYSVGRGTDAPFESIGAEFLDGVAFSRALNSRNIPGVSSYPIVFTPQSSVLSGKKLQGIHLEVTARDRLDIGRLGIELMTLISQLHPKKVELKENLKLIGNYSLIQQIAGGRSASLSFVQTGEELKPFSVVRSRYLLYR